MKKWYIVGYEYMTDVYQDLDVQELDEDSPEPEGFLEVIGGPFDTLEEAEDSLEVDFNEGWFFVRD